MNRFRFVPLSSRMCAASTSHRVVQDQCTALTADEVLRLVEAEGRHPPEGAEHLALVGRGQPVGVVLHERHVVAAGDLDQLFDVARDPGVVHGDDGLHPLVHRLLDVRGIEAEGQRR